MKKKLGILLCSLLLTGCDFNYDYSDINFYTTAYPIEYATNILYSDYANISSVYPIGSDKSYEVTDKKKEKYALGNAFIYSGIANEATLARDLINKNDNMHIIDATKGMKLNYDLSGLWLDPTNYLMMCSNIKSGLIDYNDNVYVKEQIEENYKKLNEAVSDIDVQLYNIGKNGNYDTILTTNDTLNYLTKYNINVISIDEDNQLIDKAYSQAKKLISDKKIQYIYYIEGDEFNQTQEKLISDNSLVKVEINNLFTLNDEEKTQEEDYIKIMNNIITLYKKELYKN